MKSSSSLGDIGRKSGAHQKLRVHHAVLGTSSQKEGT